jgi:signal transduction histidine kinase
VAVEVSGDGVRGADPAHGSGLRGLADRVEARGRRLRINSPPGGGRHLLAEIVRARRSNAPRVGPRAVIPADT